MSSVEPEVQAADFFDLSRFNQPEPDIPDFDSVNGHHYRAPTVDEIHYRAPTMNDYDSVHAVIDYLREGCNELDPTNLKGAVNPVRLSCLLIQGPDVNSHGELELWVANRHFDFKNMPRNFRNLGISKCSEGVVLCIDTKRVLRCWDIGHHPYLFLRDFDVYGNVKISGKEERHVPFGNFFIEIGALSYMDIGNSWTGAVYGKGFNRSYVAQE